MQRSCPICKPWLHFGVSTRIRSSTYLSQSFHHYNALEGTENSFGAKCCNSLAANGTYLLPNVVLMAYPAYRAHHFRKLLRVLCCLLVHHYHCRYQCSCFERHEMEVLRITASAGVIMTSVFVLEYPDIRLLSWNILNMPCIPFLGLDFALSSTLHPQTWHEVGKKRKIDVIHNSLPDMCPEMLKVTVPERMARTWAFTESSSAGVEFGMKASSLPELLLPHNNSLLSNIYP